MHRYTLFGGCLESALEIPGLPGSNARDATWRLTVAIPTTADASGALLGEETVDDGCMVRMHQQPAGLRLCYDDTGMFDISASGKEIVWYPADGASEESARLDVIGRVLAAALHIQGMLALHGSAVTIDGRAIAFVAPKTFGKSTLAMALTTVGAEFLSDDTLPVESGPVAFARPGIEQVRLWSDSASRLVAPVPVPPSTVKHVLTMPPLASRSRVPLAAIYLLAPAAPGSEDSAVRRDRLHSVTATVAIVRHAKLGALLGGPQAARLLGMASEVAGTVPVYRLEIARDLDRLRGAAGEIMGWHSGACPAGTSVQGAGRPIEAHESAATIHAREQPVA